MDTMAKLAAFDGQKYLSLETYRKNGEAVRTPVWFATAGGPTLYVYTTADSGKVKRLRRSGEVRIAPCDARGRVTGAWSTARAAIVDGDAFAVCDFSTASTVHGSRCWIWLTGCFPAIAVS
jgi:PPOX class probable F420-dependent enzyme